MPVSGGPRQRSEEDRQDKPRTSGSDTANAVAVSEYDAANAGAMGIRCTATVRDHHLQNFDRGVLQRRMGQVWHTVDDSDLDRAHAAGRVGKGQSEAC
jgi:hypothetical protein